MPLINTNKQHNLILVVTLLLLAATCVLTVVSGRVNEQVQWSSCSLHSEFQMPEGLKHFPRSMIPTGPSFGQIVTFVDALNELNLKKNDVYRTKAECTMFSTPLNHNDVADQSIRLFVKRLRADPNKDAPRALWLLNGGPAMASDSFELPMDMLIKMLGAQFDIYTVDHRGTGRSNRTTCTNAETLQSDEGFSISMKEWTKYGCAQALNDEMNGKAQFLNSKEAAIDVVKLIQSINVPLNQKVFVYGLSYGTVWTSRMIRYLQLTNQENLISGYILDGIVNIVGKPVKSGNISSNRNGRLVLNLFDENFNAVGQSLMEMCGGSLQRFATNQFINYNNDNSLVNRKALYELKSECSLKFEKKSNGNPVEFMKKVIDNVYNKNTCPEFSKQIQLIQLKTIFQGFLMQTSTRALLPAFIYRLDRCDLKIDIPVMLRIIQVSMQMFNAKPTSIPLASDVLKYHIVFSELWDKNSTMQQLFSQYMSPDMLIGGFAAGMQSVLDASEWPVYNLDSNYLEQAFQTNVPILMMNGNLDPNTPLWSALALQESIKSLSHNLVIIPFAPHASITGSGYGNSSIPAALQVMVNFISMETPNAFTVDTTCLDHVKFNTSGDPFISEKLFGITNIYEDYYGNISPIVSGANGSLISILVLLFSLMASMFL